MTLFSHAPQERSWRPQESESFTCNTSPCLSLPVTVHMHSPTPELTCPRTGPRGCSWPLSTSSSGQAGGWLRRAHPLRGGVHMRSTWAPILSPHDPHEACDLASRPKKEATAQPTPPDCSMLMPGKQPWVWGGGKRGARTFPLKWPSPQQPFPAKNVSTVCIIETIGHNWLFQQAPGLKAVP